MDFPQNGHVPLWLRLSIILFLPVIHCDHSIAITLGVPEWLPTIVALSWGLFAAVLMTWYRTQPWPGNAVVARVFGRSIALGLVTTLIVAAVSVLSIFVSTRWFGSENQIFVIGITMIPVLLTLRARLAALQRIKL